jgi:quercetin dioxygenase-like cupin family protein
MPDAFVTSPDRYPRALSVVGEQITVLASAAATKGYEIFLQAGPEGIGPPPHSHDWDESFFVVEGNIQFGIGAEQKVAAPGTLVHLPAGTLHWFRFGTGGGKMVSMTSRAGASALFTELDREIPPGPPDIAKLVQVATSHGLKIGPPPGA